MSCNGCRVLRKGCSESCILRSCLQWMETPEAQGYATVFVAKFFGRAGLMSFISNVPENQRPALFQSLLVEACGRTVNPVHGAVGLLRTGNWSVCQAAVETVLRGGNLSPMPGLLGLDGSTSATDDVSEANITYMDVWRLTDPTKTQFTTSRNPNKLYPGKLKLSDAAAKPQIADLDLQLMPGFSTKAPVCTTTYMRGTRRPDTPSLNSEETVTTTASLTQCLNGRDRKLLNLFT